MLRRKRPATRGQSLSRVTRNPQIESVKKNLVIESCESILESFHKGLEILLRICVRDESGGNHTMNRMLDHAIDFGDRYRKAIDIAGENPLPQLVKAREILEQLDAPATSE